MLHTRTFVPGEAVLATSSDVGHCQDPSKVPHKQQVSNTDESKARKDHESRYVGS